MPEMNVSNLRSNVFSALIVLVFQLFFLGQPVLGGQPVLSVQLCIPQG